MFIKTFPIPLRTSTTDDGVRPMSMVVWGGSAPKGEAAWGGSDDPGAGIYLQACNAPLAALLSSTADGTQGTMQYKAIPILNWAGCVCSVLPRAL